MARCRIGGDDRRDGVVGLAFAMRNVAPLLLMCDRHDLGLSIDGGSLEGATRTGGRRRRRARSAGCPSRTIFIYDNYPGGIGFSEPLFDMHEHLLARTRELIDGCPCAVGLPVVRRARRATPVRTPSRWRRESSSGCWLVRQLLPPDVPRSGMPISRRGFASIVRPAERRPPRELTYEPDTGRYEATIDVDRVADVLGGQVVGNRFGACARSSIGATNPTVFARRAAASASAASRTTRRCACWIRSLPPRRTALGGPSATVFVDLETTGLSGGAGTVAFLVGCGWFDMGAFQVRQFLLTSYASERALLDAVASCFEAAVAARDLQRQDVRRAGDGNALDVSSHAHAARVRPPLRHAASGASAVAQPRRGAWGGW